MTDLRRSLRDEVDRVRPPELWGAIEARATAPQQGPDVLMDLPSRLRRADRPPPARSRLTATVVGLAVFAGLAVGLWSLLRSTGAPSGTACAVGERVGPSSVGSLDDVDALGPRDVWAVGQSASRETQPGLVLHFDGRAWSRLPLPDAAGELTGVAALSDADVWVVGRRLLHYDGARWLVFESPVPIGASTVFGFNNVVALAADDVWAAGSFGTDDGHVHAFAAHWDGSAWTVAETPSRWIAWSSTAFGIDARSSDDVWVVGARSSSDAGTIDRSFAMHWDGEAWRTVPTTGAGVLYDIAIVRSSEVWAVGSGSAGSVVERWNGSRWRVVRQAEDPTNLHAVAADRGRVWAAGGDAVLRLAGATWSSAAPVPGTSLLGISAADGHAWAVGTTSSGRTLVEHHC
ncbi:MAG: hypothetical protein ACJ77A_07420 [Actinomycetota bacterium]